MPERIERFEGCLLGLALGDALGAPLEGMKTGRIRQAFGDVEGFVDSVAGWPGKPSHWRLSGLYGDDAQQALALAETLLEKERGDGERTMALYLQLRDALKGDSFSCGGHRAVGPNFRKALQAMSEGGDAFLCGQPDAGCGAAARIAPVGLFFPDDQAALRTAVIEASLITHNDPRALAGAAALAYAVGCLAALDGDETPEVDELCADICSFTREFEEQLKDEYWDFLDPKTRISGAFQLSDSLRVLAPAVREANDDLARRSIVAAANRCQPEFPLKDANQDFAPAAVLIALYYGLHYDNFSHGILAAINDGRKADSVGAMTGALLGVRLGRDSIPENWLKELHNAEQVALRGRMLAAGEIAQTMGDIDWSARRNFVELECELTQLEHQSLRESQRQLEKRREREAKRRPPKPKKAPAPKQAEAAFAPPPELWLAGGGADPDTQRREKEARGKKRIGWKEEQRRQRRRK